MKGIEFSLVQFPFICLNILIPYIGGIPDNEIKLFVPYRTQKVFISNIYRTVLGHLRLQFPDASGYLISVYITSIDIALHYFGRIKCVSVSGSDDTTLNLQQEVPGTAAGLQYRIFR